VGRERVGHVILSGKCHDQLSPQASRMPYSCMGNEKPPEASEYQEKGAKDRAINCPIECSGHKKCAEAGQKWAILVLSP
jgi:hypothetical protein